MSDDAVLTRKKKSRLVTRPEPAPSSLLFNGPDWNFETLGRIFDAVREIGCLALADVAKSIERTPGYDTARDVVEMLLPLLVAESVSVDVVIAAFSALHDWCSLVPREDLSAAIGMNASLFNLAQILGPAAAGLIIAAFNKLFIDGGGQPDGYGGHGNGGGMSNGDGYGDGFGSFGDADGGNYNKCPEAWQAE